MIFNLNLSNLNYFKFLVFGFSPKNTMKYVIIKVTYLIKNTNIKIKKLE